MSTPYNAPYKKAQRAAERSKRRVYQHVGFETDKKGNVVKSYKLIGHHIGLPWRGKGGL